MQNSELFGDGNPSIVERLGERHKRIITANLDAFDGASVLDLASNNGRWSYAALNAGAAKVTSIEGRAERVEMAQGIFRQLGLANRVDCHTGDMFRWLWAHENDRFDTVLCLGVYYHITDHYGFLKQIARTQPKTIIIDSGFVRSFRNGVFIMTENPRQHKNALPTHKGQVQEFAGSVSLGMMIQMAWNLGYNCRPVVWDPKEVDAPLTVIDYLTGIRFTLRLDKMEGFRDADWQSHWRDALGRLSPDFVHLVDPTLHDVVAESVTRSPRKLIQNDCTIMELPEDQAAQTSTARGKTAYLIKSLRRFASRARSFARRQ